MKCPNINSPQWKDLVAKIGVFEAFKEYRKNDFEIPDASQYQETFKGVNATLKIVNALQLLKRTSYPSNNVQGFYNDLVKNGAPANQIELLKGHIAQKNITDIDIPSLIISLLSEMSYIVEINTAKYSPKTNRWQFSYDPDYGGKDKPFVVLDNVDGLHQNFATQEEAYKFIDSKGTNTSYYSNLTVPGGTNGSYIEANIETPMIVPSIQSHAQFKTDNTIGWMRADEKQNYQEKDIDNLIEIMKKSGILEVNCD